MTENMGENLRMTLKDKKVRGAYQRAERRDREKDDEGRGERER